MKRTTTAGANAGGGSGSTRPVSASTRRASGGSALLGPLPALKKEVHKALFSPSATASGRKPPLVATATAASSSTALAATTLDATSDFPVHSAADTVKEQDNDGVLAAVNALAASERKQTPTKPSASSGGMDMETKVCVVLWMLCFLFFFSSRLFFFCL